MFCAVMRKLDCKISACPVYNHARSQLHVRCTACAESIRHDVPHNQQLNSINGHTSAMESSSQPSTQCLTPASTSAHTLRARY